MENRIVRQKAVWAMVVAVALAALLLFAACAPATPLENEKVVEIGMIAPLTGGAATMAQLVLTAQIDYTRYFNEELGIPGATLKLIWINTAMDQAKILSAYHRLAEP